METRCGLLKFSGIKNPYSWMKLNLLSVVKQQQESKTTSTTNLKLDAQSTDVQVYCNIELYIFNEAENKFFCLFCCFCCFSSQTHKKSRKSIISCIRNFFSLFSVSLSLFLLLFLGVIFFLGGYIYIEIC